MVQQMYIIEHDVTFDLPIVLVCSVIPDLYFIRNIKGQKKNFLP